MKFFLRRTGSALVTSIVAALLMLGALSLTPTPAGAAAVHTDARPAF